MNKKTRYRIIFYLIFWLVILYIRTDNFRDFAYNKGEFNDVIIENYNKEAAEKGFQQVSINKFSDDNRVNRTSSEQININETLTLFNDLYLVKDNGDWHSKDKKYDITFHNINTHEKIEIEIFDESHINVWIRFVEKKVDRNKKIISYDQDLVYYRYYVQTGTIDLTRIEELFNSMDS